MGSAALLLLLVPLLLEAAGTVGSPDASSRVAPFSPSPLGGSSASTLAARAPSTTEMPSATAPPTGVVWSSDPLLSAVEGRQGAAVASETGTDLALVFGGSNGTGGAAPLNTTYVVWYGNQSVHEVPTPSSLTARSGASLVWDAPSERFVLFGGRLPGPTYLNDTWWFFPQNLSWELACPSTCHAPSPRWGASMVAEPGADLAVLYGGQGYANPALSDTWAYTVSGGWTNVTTGTSPPALESACAAAPSGGAGFFLFGGAQADGLLSPQTWELTWSDYGWSEVTTVTAPPARSDCSFVPTGPDGDALLYGGENASAYYGDAWTFDPSTSTWTDLGTQTPGALGDSAIFSWPVDGVTALWAYGGANRTDPGLTESWSGSLLPLSTPVLSTPHVSAAVVGDPWSVTVEAAVAGGLLIDQVNLSVVYPGGGAVRGALLTLGNGTGTDGNWTATLPASADPGPLAWNLSALDSAGGSAWVAGSSYCSPGLGRLQGFVYGLSSIDGHPASVTLAGAQVTITGSGPGNETTVATNGSGGYSVPLAAGTYSVNVSFPGYATEENRSTVRWEETTSFDFLLPSTSTSSGVDFVGNVTESATSPTVFIGGVSIWVNATSVPLTYPENSTTSNGTFAFDLEPDVTYQATFSYPGWVPQTFSFFLATGTILHHDVSMAPTSTADELVVDIAPSTDTPQSGSQLVVNITVENGNKVPVSNGAVLLALTRPGYYSLETPPSGAPLDQGRLSVRCTLPGGILVNTTYFLNATVSVSGFPTVKSNISILVVPVPKTGTVPPSGPSPTPWTTYVALAALAAAVAILVGFILYSRSSSRVEEIFLIYKGGKLVWHASRTARADLEPEVVTGMLQAVEGFVERSFTPDGGHLNVLDFANMKLHIVRGERLTAAALLSGRNLKETVRQVSAGVADMEKAWAGPLAEWDGTTTSLPHLRQYVDALLDGYYYRHSHLRVTESSEPGGAVKP